MPCGILFWCKSCRTSRVPVCTSPHIPAVSLSWPRKTPTSTYSSSGKVFCFTTVPVSLTLYCGFFLQDRGHVNDLSVTYSLDNDSYILDLRLNRSVPDKKKCSVFIYLLVAFAEICYPMATLKSIIGMVRKLPSGSMARPRCISCASTKDKSATFQSRGQPFRRAQD